MNPIHKSFQYISQGNNPEEHIQHSLQFLKAGGKWIQLRMKAYAADDVRKTTEQLIQKTAHFNYQLILNDHVEVAASFKGVGCHLGKDDMPLDKARHILGSQRVLGATANTMEDIRLINQFQVDYIGLGPFAFTSTKKKLSPILGLEGYANILRSMNKEGIKHPVIAIGGILEKDIQPLMEMGIFSIAASSLFTKPSQELSHLLKLN